MSQIDSQVSSCSQSHISVTKHRSAFSSTKWSSSIVSLLYSDWMLDKTKDTHLLLLIFASLFSCIGIILSLITPYVLSSGGVPFQLFFL